MDYFQTTSHLKGKIYSLIGAAFIALPFFGGTRQIDVTEGVCLALPKISLQNEISSVGCVNLLWC